MAELQVKQGKDSFRIFKAGAARKSNYFFVDSGNALFGDSYNTVNVAVSGTFAATGASTLSGALTVTGAFTLTGASTIVGAIGLTGALTVTGALDVTGKLDTEDTQTGGASNGNIIKKTLQAGEAYTGTTAGLMVKHYDADNTATVPSGEFTGLYINVKGLHTSPGDNASLISAHVHGSNTTVIHAGLWMYGSTENAIKSSSGTHTNFLNLNQVTDVTNFAIFADGKGATVGVTDITADLTADAYVTIVIDSTTYKVLAWTA